MSRKTPLAVVVAALVFIATVAGTVYYALTLPDVYSGETVVQFSPRMSDNGYFASGDVIASGASGYVAYLGAPSTMSTVAQTINTSEKQLRDDVTVTLIPATTTVTVVFDATDPQLAARGANAMAAAAVARSTNDPLVSATILAPASVPQLPSGPRRPLILAAGVLLAGLLAAVAYLLVNLIASRSGAGGSADEPSG